MALRLIEAPAEEPVTLEEAKLHTRVGDTPTASDIDDDILEAQLIAARQWAETFTGRQLVTATWELVMDDFPTVHKFPKSWAQHYTYLRVLTDDPIVLPRPPLQEVVSITYHPDDDDAQEFDLDKVIVDTASEPGRIVLHLDEAWPDDTLQAANGVVIRFKAGYGDPEDVPEGIKRAILMVVGNLYEHREEVVTGTIATRIPFAAHALLWPHRASVPWV